MDSPQQPTTVYLEYEVENDVTKSYLSDVDYQDDSLYSYTGMKGYDKQATAYRKDIPSILKVTIPLLSELDNTNRYVRITEGNADTLLFPFICNNVITFENLKPNSLIHIDTIHEKDGKEIVVDSKCVSVNGHIRMIHLDGYQVGNIRDLGGWKTINGGEIVYGHLYRGGELYREKEGKTLISISEKGIESFINELKIGVELDFGDISQSSPLENTEVEFIHGTQYAIQAYAKGLETARLRDRYASCIRLILEKLYEGKNIYFHCNAGADRTGTLAFFIEALLGVGESDLSKDYELTSFSCLNTPRYRDSDSFKSLLFFFKDNFPGKNLNEQVYNMATSSLEENGLGLSKEEIDLLRSILIE